MNKAAIRKEYKKKRLEISEHDLLKWEDLMLIRFQELDIEIPETMMVYAAMESAGEFDPEYIVEYCAFKNPSLKVAYPVINTNKEMAAIAVDTDTAFAEHAFGMKEPVGGEQIPPEIIDLVIVPLLAFDKKGFRVGFGKGYYDKFLKECRKDCLKIGVSFFEPIDKIEDIHDGDVKLDYCITPFKTYGF